MTDNNHIDLNQPSRNQPGRFLHSVRILAVAFIIGAAVFTTGDQTASAKITANATAFAAHNAPLHSRISTPPPPPQR